MRNGPLRHRVRVETLARARDRFGGRTGTGWTLLAEVWASVDPELSRAQLLYSQQIEQAITHAVRLHYIAGVTVDSRIIHEDRVLEVVSVRDPGERHRDLELLCREVVA